MIPTISFMLANYAARPLAYQMDGWAQAEQATSAYFQPIQSFAARFEVYLADVRALGFAAVDLWLPMLDPRWLSDPQLETAVDLLAEYDLQVVSLAASPEGEFERTCEVAAALGAPLLSGGPPAPDERDTLRKYGLQWAYETETEAAPDSILTRIGGDEDVIGVCADTGWLASHGCDAADALRTLAPRLFHVHLKDVRGDGQTCRYGRGIVPVERCVRVLQEIGYGGAISIEHETASFDPSEDCRANLELLQRWLKVDSSR